MFVLLVSTVHIPVSTKFTLIDDIHTHSLLSVNSNRHLIVELLKNRHKFEEEELTNLRILEFLLHHPKININVVDNCGQTPLLLAVMSGNINCVALLLNKGTVQIPKISLFLSHNTK
jgi:ankyrin repeat protein